MRMAKVSLENPVLLNQLLNELRVDGQTIENVKVCSVCGSDMVVIATRKFVSRYRRCLTCGHEIVTREIIVKTIKKGMKK